MLYCMVNKYKIYWFVWFYEYIFKSVADAHTSTSLPYGLLITIILFHYFIDLSEYPTVEVSATYDSKTFSSMGYVLLYTEW